VTTPGTAVEGTPIRFEHVHKSFGANPVLHDVSVDFPGGTTSCVIGPSGSGKSTVLRCINRLETPERGRIWLGPEEVTAPGIEVDRLRARIGMVFQRFHLFPHLTAVQNVSLALVQVRRMSKTEAEETATRRLREVGLGRLESRRPDQLSGGQQQRVAIARALAMEPELMLFDEATSSLDPELVKGVLDLMRDLASRGITMVVVTHELRFAREVARQVVFLDEGHLVESGSPHELFECPKSPRLRHFLEQML
jgi:ABC-type polar amino acid transport system ATPase subunit